MTRTAKKYSLIDIFSIGLTNAFTVKSNQRLQRKNDRQDKSRSKKERQFKTTTATHSSSQKAGASEDFSFINMAFDQVIISANSKTGLHKSVQDLENALRSMGQPVTLSLVENGLSSSVSLEKETYIAVSGSAYGNISVTGSGLVLNGEWLTDGKALYQALS